MGRIYSAISDRLYRSGRLKETLMKLQNSTDPMCWRCGSSEIIPSKPGGDINECYYCKNCEEHYINS